MTNQGGGWTLFAHHADGISEISVPEIVNTSNYGTLREDRWQAVRNNMNVGMLFIDESDRQSRLSSHRLNSDGCKKIQDVGYLSKNGNAYGRIWHNERSGCDAKGGDYNMVQLYGDGYEFYKIAGAALYQMAGQVFDVWGYGKNKYSYDVQNELQYYIK